MKRFVGGIATVTLALGLTAGPLAAQFDNVPVYYFPTFDPGWSINVDFAMGGNEDSEFFPGEKPMAYGGQVMVGGAIGYLYAGFHLVDPKDPADPATVDKGKSFGGGGALTLYNKGSQGFVSNLQIGGGTTSYNVAGVEGAKYSIANGIAGVSAGFAGGSEAVKFEVYAAPRAQVVNYKAEFTGITGRTRFGFGASGGVNVQLQAGIGLYAGIDWYTINLTDDSAGDSIKPLVFGFGINYHGKVPGWGTAHGLIGG